MWQTKGTEVNLKTTAALLMAATTLSACGNTPQAAAVKADRKRRAARVLAPRVAPAIQTAEQSQS